MRLPTLTNPARTAAWFLACLIAVDAVYWVLSAATWPEHPEAPTRPLAPASLATGDVARLLGGTATADPGADDSHFQLRGVISGPGDLGAAVITVSGSTRTYALGAKVTEGWVLSALSAGEATLTREPGPTGEPASAGAATLQLHVPREHDPARPRPRPLPR